MNQSKGHRLNYWLSEFTPWEMPRLHRLFNNLLLNIQRMPLTLAGWRTHSLKNIAKGTMDPRVEFCLPK